MYPFLRLAYQSYRARRAPPLAIFGTHVSHHLCLPWDLDLWNELNNGRTLTIYDLGRIPLAIRTGLIALLQHKSWGLTIAGTVIRYRRRVRLFDRVEIQSRLIGWDKRFLYIEQSMWNARGDCTSQAILRSALTDGQGIVTTDRVAAALEIDQISPVMPDWVMAWIAAEDMRPWPPEKIGSPEKTGLSEKT